MILFVANPDAGITQETADQAEARNGPLAQSEEARTSECWPLQQLPAAPPKIEKVLACSTPYGPDP
jgi:hypothetical protein